MSTQKHVYETTIIINASLDDPQIDNVINRVQETITKNGGTITAVNKWGRKRLAYSINKKTTGFYMNMEFEAPGTLLPTLERSFQLDELILRDLTIVLDKKALAARKPLPVAAPQPEAAPAREPLFTEQPDDKKV